MSLLLARRCILALPRPWVPATPLLAARTLTTFGLATGEPNKKSQQKQTKTKKKQVSPPKSEQGVLPKRGVPVPKIPLPSETIKTPGDFLKAIGRNEQDKFKVGEEVTWEQFFSYKGVDLKIAEVSIRDRRYILWAMQQFRRGRQPEYFRYERKVKKIRGHGPSVQNGKMLRSKRHKLPKKAQLKLTMHGLVTPPNLLAKEKREQAERKAARKAARK